MSPMAIIDIIAWKVPYILGHIFKFIVFFVYMLRINIGLTTLSIIFMVVFRFGVLRPIDKKFEVCIFDFSPAFPPLLPRS